MRKTMLGAALVAAVASVNTRAQAQVVINENFDDGAGATRWDFVAREAGVDSTISGTVPDAAVDFNFNYAAAPVTTGQPTLIGSAPHGGGGIGVKINSNDGNGSVTQNIIAAGAILPKSVGVSGNWTMTADVFFNCSDPLAAGSSELASWGLRVGDNNLVGIDLNATTAAGGLAQNASADGYAFMASSDGGLSGDYRVYALRQSNDDGPNYQKRNAAWTGASREPVFDNAGVYTGVETIPNETLFGGNFNSYYVQEVLPASAGYTMSPGSMGKAWTTLTVEQHGKIVDYLLNGKVVNTLFTTAALSGKPQLGSFDPANSTPTGPTAVDSYVVYDNIVVTQEGASAQNAIPAGELYPVFNAGGTVTANGDSTVRGLTFDSATATNLAGTGTVTLGQPAGAIYAGGGAAHSISKALKFNAATAVYVDTPTDSLTISNGSWGSNVVFHKLGQGTLTLSKGFQTKAMTVDSGTLKLDTGVSKTGLLYFEYGSATTTANTGRLDFYRSVIAVDYSNATSVDPVTTPLSPLTRLVNALTAGFAADAANGGNPLWNGPGLVTSAPEVAGAAFYDANNKFTVRIFEASALGFGASEASLGASGVTVDGTTVILGLSFKADTNFDQVINFTDLVNLAQNYNQNGLDPMVSWIKGDSNADGSVNFTDLVALAQNYNKTVATATSAPTISASAFAADWALAQSLVPEPTSLAALGLGGLLLRRRR